MIPFFGPSDIAPILDIAALVPSAKQAYQAISTQTAQSPVVILYPNDQADIHIKSAVLPDCPIFTVKMAGWSQLLANRNELPTSGIIVVFDSITCRPLAIVQDDHLISDLRTAAAGALVAQIIAPQEATSALIVGTGAQARLQAEALLISLPIERIEVWGRDQDKADALASDLLDAFPQCGFNASANLANSVAAAEVIVTATGAKNPVIQADWLRPGQHLTSVGSDDATKCEIDPAAFASARVFVDSHEAAAKCGSTHRAIATGVADGEAFTELGTLHGEMFGRHPQELTITCLSGLGIQDLTAMNHLWAAIGPGSS